MHLIRAKGLSAELILHIRGYMGIARFAFHKLIKREDKQHNETCRCQIKFQDIYGSPSIRMRYNFILKE